MKTYSEYTLWLDEAREKATEEKTKKSIQKLTNLLHDLDSKNVFDKDASRILQRLESLVKNVEQKPERTRYFLDSCFADMVNIAAKFYALVRKNHYQNEWTAYGTSFGIVLGVIMYAFTNNAAFLAIGLPIGLSAGLGIGTLLDRSASRGGRRIIDQ